MICRQLLFLVILHLFSSLLIAGEKDVDYLSLVAVLIKDGHYDRAEAALLTLETMEKVEQKAIEDKKRFYILRGIIQLHKKEFANAKLTFIKAINLGDVEPVVYVYLAQAAYGDKDYRTALNGITKAGWFAKSKKSLYTLKAQSHWQLNEKNEAWFSLVDGLEKFPGEPMFFRQQTFFLLELKLYQDAITVGNKYLNRPEAKVADYLVISSSLRKSHQPGKAIPILERAKLRFPEDIRVVIELANAYLETEKIVAAAELFQYAASIDSNYMSEASELFKRAGKLDRALSLNAQVRDRGKKLKQRLAILIEYGDFELAAAMEKPLFRVGLLKNEDIRYASAYSLYKAGQFSKASKQLNYITRPDLFRKSTELRKVMQGCEAAAWSCF